MKTVVLQGTQEDFNNLYQNVFDEDTVPQEVEIRVYVVNITELSKDLHCDDARELTDEEFVTESERQGTVYSLQGFQIAVNYEELYLDESYVRFISVPLNK